MNEREFLDLRVGDFVFLDEITAPYFYFDKEDGEFYNLSEDSNSNIHRFIGGVKVCVTRIDGNNVYVRDEHGYEEVVVAKHLKLKEEDEMNRESVEFIVGDVVTIDETTTPFTYYSRPCGKVEYKSNMPPLDAEFKIIEIRDNGNFLIENTSLNYSDIISPRHLKLVEKKQENTMENVQTVQSPITLEEAKANIGKTVYFIESSQPYSHSTCVWGKFETQEHKLKGVTRGTIHCVDGEDIQVKYKASYGVDEKAHFSTKHLSFTSSTQEENMATGKPYPEIETPQTDETFTFKQMLEHIGNGGYAQVFTDKTANLAYHKWHDVREYAIGELEEYSKFRKVVQVATPQNKTYLTKEDLLFLLEQLK